MNAEAKDGMEVARINRQAWEEKLNDMLAEIRFGNLRDEELDDECHRISVLFDDILAENYFLSTIVAIRRGRDLK